MNEIVFQQSPPFTLGVEVEFQILNRDSLDLVSQASQLIKEIDVPFSGKIAREFIQSIIEIQTSVCHSIRDVASDLGATIKSVEKAADSLNCLLFASSLHPFARPSEQKLTEDERYERIMEELQYVGRQFISQGLHVHVGMEEKETAIVVCDVIQVYLPILLSLSTSSPYFCGEDTGLQSYRTKLFEALPLAGISGFLGNWRQYEREVVMLQKNGVIREIHDLWWDVRPSPCFGTIEVRICDLPSNFSDILALTAIVQSLAVIIAAGGIKPVPVSPQMLRFNKWQASRYGLDGSYVDPLGVLGTENQPLRQAARRLLDFLQETMRKMDSESYSNQILRILENGTSADRQRSLAGKSGDYKKMIAQLHTEFWS